MTMMQWSVNMEISVGDILQSLIDDLGSEELVDFVDELVERMADGDFTNELYELMRRKHDEWLETTGIDEAQYQSEFADPSYYEGIEASVAEEPIDDEPDKVIYHETWNTEDDSVDDDEDPMDVFTTE